MHNINKITITSTYKSFTAVLFTVVHKVKGGASAP